MSIYINKDNNPVDAIQYIGYSQFSEYPNWFIEQIKEGDIAIIDFSENEMKLLIRGDHITMGAHDFIFYDYNTRDVHILLHDVFNRDYTKLNFADYIDQKSKDIQTEVILSNDITQDLPQQFVVDY